MGGLRAAGLAAQFGFSVVGSHLVCVLLGQYLDHRLHTSPTFFLIGLLLGFVASIYLIYLIYRLQVQPACEGRCRTVDGYPR
jgi:F0F1-type ATP synthase assembly protein I